MRHPHIPPSPRTTRPIRARLLALVTWALAAALFGPACRANRDRAGLAHDASAETARPGDAAGVREELGQGADDPRPVPLPGCEHPAVRAAAPPGPGEGVLRVRLPADPPHLDPLAESNELATQVLAGLVSETLLSCAGSGDDRRAPAPAPGLAARWELAPAGNTITLHLRPEAVFHDGRAVTVNDVRASLSAVWRGEARLPHARAALADLAAIEPAGPGALRLRLKRPSPLTLWALCEIPVVPARATARRGPHRESPVGTGPFRLAAWNKGKSVRLVRFARPGLPLAPLAEIRFDVEPDTGRALRRLRRGELDLLPRLDPVHFPDQVRPAALGPGLVLVGAVGERLTLLAVNHRRPPLGEVAVRRALSLLWDRAAFAAELHLGLVTPIGAPGLPDLPPPKLDPAAAAALLRTAGVLPPAGTAAAARPAIRHRLTLLHTGGRHARAELRRFAERLRRVGLFLDLVSVEPGELGDRVRAGDFDLALVSWQGRPFEDPRPRFSAAGPFTLGALASPRIEALLAEWTASDSEAARPGLQQRLAQLLADELPGIFLYRHHELAVVSGAVRGLCHRGGRLELAGVSLAP